MDYTQVSSGEESGTESDTVSDDWGSDDTDCSQFFARVEWIGHGLDSKHETLKSESSQLNNKILRLKSNFWGSGFLILSNAASLGRRSSDKKVVAHTLFYNLTALGATRSRWRLTQTLNR